MQKSGTEILHKTLSRNTSIRTVIPVKYLNKRLLGILRQLWLSFFSFSFFRASFASSIPFSSSFCFLSFFHSFFFRLHTNQSAEDSQKMCGCRTICDTVTSKSLIHKQEMWNWSGFNWRVQLIHKNLTFSVEITGSNWCTTYCSCRKHCNALAMLRCVARYLNNHLDLHFSLFFYSVWFLVGEITCVWWSHCLGEIKKWKLQCSAFWLHFDCAF